VERGAGSSRERRAHEGLDVLAALGAAHGPEKDLAVLGEELGVGIEVAGVEREAVVDEELVDLRDVFESSEAVLEGLLCHFATPRSRTAPSPR
jgi:hypothetical protein